LMGRMFMFAAVLAVGSVGAFAEDSGDALVPFKVNVRADIVAVTVTDVGRIVYSDYLNVTAGEEAVLKIPLQRAVGVINVGQKGRSNKPAVVRCRAGKVSLSLPAQSYKNAEISLYTLNGKRILQSKASALNASNNISRRSVVAGVYMLQVKGVDGNATVSRLTHRGGGLDISVAFVGENAASNPARMAKSAAAEADAGSAWYILIYSEDDNFLDSVYTFTPNTGVNTLQNITLRSKPATGGPWNMAVVLGRNMSATGSGTYEAGATVAINAGTAPAGREFRQWNSMPASLTFAQKTNKATTFIMPTLRSSHQAVMVGAVFSLPPGGDNRLVGDWKGYSMKNLSTGEIKISDDEKDGIGVLTVQQSGTAMFTQFSKVENVWIESSDDGGLGLVSMDGSYLYVMTGKLDIEELKIQYRFSANGNEFVLVNTGRDCDYEYNSETGEEISTCTEYDIEATYKKVNFAAVRSGLGTVYSTDPAIYGYWELQGSYDDDYGRPYIGFHQGNFDGNNLQRYFPDIEDSYVTGYWYKNGNKLYLIAEVCHWDWETGEREECTTTKVELTYSLTGSGSGKTLKINADTWKFEDDDYYYSQSKSKSKLKQGKVKHDAKSAIFAFPKKSKG